MCLCLLGDEKGRGCAGMGFSGCFKMRMGKCSSPRPCLGWGREIRKNLKMGMRQGCFDSKFPRAIPTFYSIS